MADMGTNRIGASLDDLDALQAALESTGSHIGDHAAAGTDRAQRAASEIGEVTSRLAADFGELAAALREAVARSSALMEVAEWDGRSRVAATEANHRFSSEIDAALARAIDGAESLRRSLAAQVGAFHDEVSGSFAVILADIRERYARLAAGTRSYAAVLAEHDATALRNLQ